MPRFSTAPNSLTPTVGIYSFGVKGNITPKCQFTVDVTKFRDPSGQKQFKNLNGIDPEVRDWVGEDARMAGVVENCLLIADDLLKPKAVADGEKTTVAPASAWLSIAFKDHHGRWAAPAVAELVAEALSKAGFTVATTHYGLKEADGKPVVL